MTWDGANRRKFVRIAYPCLVKISAKGSAQEMFLTHTENLSAGGICIIVKKEMKLFTPIDIEIDLIDDMEHVTVHGHVAWVVKRKDTETHKPMFYDIGVEFENLSGKNKSKLEAAVNQLIDKGYKILKPVN